eukprot:TRINITY_DN4306_c0_g1_i1.p1 TRINITY_DN4306_c0_g1~~TRINITY_DN4306_c0_g1_i1.p1  ORF type:complete len:350 (-),score=35.75 TRINITY_DN4306_c0_g1_i1:120-1139(-)
MEADEDDQWQPEHGVNGEEKRELDGSSYNIEYRSRYYRIKHKIAQILQVEKSRKNHWIKSFIDRLIIINVIAATLETVESWYSAYLAIFFTEEWFSMFVFSAEYLLRLFCCTTTEQYQGRIKGRLKWMIQPLSILDLLAVLPSWYGFFYFCITGNPATDDWLRVLKLLRLGRMFSLFRNTIALQVLIKVVRSKSHEFGVLLIILLNMELVASSLMYIFEHEAQPEKFGNIPISAWFGISTLTAIAYGDVYPVTPLGKIFTSFFCIIGLAWFALPAGLLAAGYTEQFNKMKEVGGRCVLCGSKKGKIRFYEGLGLGGEDTETLIREKEILSQLHIPKNLN